MSEKQQTAVEWLEKRYYFTNGQLIDVDFEQAKELFEKQIKSSFFQGEGSENMTAQEYYSKTYSK